MKTSRSVLLSKPMVVVSLITGLVLVAGTAILFAVSTRDIARASNQVAGTQTTLLAINQLRSSLIDSETGQRGYILTGLESYLEPYTQASAQFDKELAQLRPRFTQSPEQIAMLDQVAKLMASKRAEMSRTIELRRAPQISPSLHRVDSGAGLKAMSSLRLAIDTLEKHELSALAFHSASVSSRAEFFQIVSLVMLITACVLGATVVVLFIRRMHELETIITVCAWTHRVKYQGAWVSFEDYLRARFNLRFTHGISEEAAKKLKMEAVELVEAHPRRFKVAPS